MAWIKTIEGAEVQEPLQSTYERVRWQMGMVPNIVKVFSLHPGALRATIVLFQTLVYEPAPLSRAQREMIALVVSVINRCHY